VATRVSRLAARDEVSGVSAGGGRSGASDDIRSIESAVDRLRQEAAQARDEAARRAAETEVSRREMAQLLADASLAATRAVDEVRLPLHILLENRFGDLNENQEEMLGAAQSAAEGASALLRRVRLLADLERGAIDPRRDVIRLDEVIAGLLPRLQSEAERRQVRVRSELEPGLPRIAGDRTLIQEALGLIAVSIVRGAPAGSEVGLTAFRVPGGARLVVSPAATMDDAFERLLVRRLVAALGIGLGGNDRETSIELKAASAAAISAAVEPSR
jgi:signal transduction histidine kinase